MNNPEDTNQGDINQGSDEANKVLASISNVPVENVIVPDSDSNDEVFRHDQTRQLGGRIQTFFESIEGLDGSPEKRRSFFAQMTPEDFIDITKRTSGAVRGLKDLSEAEFDGEYEKALAGNSVPNKKDKVKIMKKYWELATNILNDETLSNHQEALAYAAILASNAIVLCHPLVDTNGRVSRLVSYAIFKGIPTKEIWENSLSNHGGEMENSDDNRWSLEASDTSMHRFDKNDFESPFQPDFVNYDINRSKEFGYPIRPWVIRAIIDEYSNKPTVQAAIEGNTTFQDGRTILDGHGFLLAVVGEGVDLSKEEARRIHNKEVNAGNFLRAMKTNSPYAYLDDSESTVIKSNDFESHSNSEPFISRLIRRKKMLEYFFPQVDFSSRGSIEKAIKTLSLKNQILIVLAGYNQELSKIYEDKQDI